LQDATVASEAFLILSYYTSANERYALSLLQLGIFPVLLSQLQVLYLHGPLALSLIRTLGNLVCATDDATTSLLSNPHFLPTLGSCLQSESK